VNIESLSKLRAGNTVYSVSLDSCIVWEIYVSRVYRSRKLMVDGVGMVFLDGFQRIIRQGNDPTPDTESMEMTQILHESCSGLLRHTRSKKEAFRWADEVAMGLHAGAGDKFFKQGGMDKLKEVARQLGLIVTP
jgi:hypothetical protein